MNLCVLMIAMKVHALMIGLFAAYLRLVQWQVLYIAGLAWSGLIQLEIHTFKGCKWLYIN